MIVGLAACGAQEFDEAEEWLVDQPGVVDVSASGSYSGLVYVGTISAQLDPDLGESAVEELAHAAGEYLKEGRVPGGTSLELVRDDVVLEVRRSREETEAALGLWWTLLADERIAAGRAGPDAPSMTVARDDVIEVFTDYAGRLDDLGATALSVSDARLDGDEAPSIELHGSGPELSACVDDAGVVALLQDVAADPEVGSLNVSPCADWSLRAASDSVADVAERLRGRLEQAGLAGADAVVESLEGTGARKLIAVGAETTPRFDAARILDASGLSYEMPRGSWTLTGGDTVVSTLEVVAQLPAASLPDVLTVRAGGHWITGAPTALDALAEPFDEFTSTAPVGAVTARPGEMSFGMDSVRPAAAAAAAAAAALDESGLWRDAEVTVLFRDSLTIRDGYLEPGSIDRERDDAASAMAFVREWLERHPR